MSTEHLTFEELQNLIKQHLKLKEEATSKQIQEVHTKQIRRLREDGLKRAEYLIVQHERYVAVHASEVIQHKEEIKKLRQIQEELISVSI